MAKPCSVCAHPEVRQINESVQNGTSGRRIASMYRVAPSSLARHRAHASVQPPAGPGGTHLTAANAVIAAVRLLREGHLDEFEEADAEQLRAIAAAVDDRPGDVTLARELRLSRAAFKKAAVQTDPTEQETLAALVASMSGPPNAAELFRRVYDKAIAAGASPEIAGAAAQAATDPAGDDEDDWPQRPCR